MQFVRTLWGDSGRWAKVLNDIKFIKNHKFKTDYTCFTYGIENHESLLEQEIESILIHDEPTKFPRSQLWGHKIYSWLKASEIYDRFIYLDFDVVPTRELPEDFDESLEDKKLQVSLRRYVKVRCRWRANKYASRQIPCASWIYFGDNNIPKDLWELWHKMNNDKREERVIAKYTEHNGELDKDYYWKNFEPHGETNYCNLERETSFRKRDKKGDSLFKHVAHHKFSVPKEKLRRIEEERNYETH
jgi:hypothetical protein